MATKKSSKREPDESDHVITTGGYEIRTDEFGNLLSCVEIESGDDVPLPSDLRYLAS